MSNKQTSAVVLAAGRGSRLNASGKNKAMYPLAGKPMLAYTLELLKKVGLERIFIVVGYAKDSIISYFGLEYKYVEQKKRLGTADAVKVVLPHLDKTVKNILVINADDSAFYPYQVIKKLIDTHNKNKADLTFLTVEMKKPNIARVLRDENKAVIGVIEQQNLKKDQEKIKEINCGCYCFSLPFLQKFLPQVKKNQLSKEYYITQLIELGVKNNCRVKTFKMSKEAYFQGVNTKNQLNEADLKMKKKLDLKRS